MRDYLAATTQFNSLFKPSRPHWPATCRRSTPASNAATARVAGRIALFWEGKDGRSATVTFSELQDQAARLANFLLAQG